MAVSFWDLVQRYRDESGASEAWIMRRAGLNKGTFTAWRQRGIPSLPERSQLQALADALRVDYAVLLDTILRDTGYAPDLPPDDDLADVDVSDDAPQHTYGLALDAEAARRDTDGSGSDR